VHFCRETLEANRSKFEPLFKLFDLEYGAASVLMTPDGIEIFSTTGTRQGGSTAGLKFAIGLHPVLQRFFAKFGNSINIKSYLDDINLASANPATLVEGIKFLEAEMGKVGLRVNRKKSWWLGPEPPVDLEGFQFADSSTDCIRVVGGFIGADAAVKAELMKMVKKCDLAFENLKLAPKQLSTALLSKCVATKMVFLLRTHSPEETAEIQTAFDSRIVAAIEEVAEIKTTATTRDMMSLPASMGGFGLPRCADIAAGCYRSSLAEANGVKKFDSQKKETARVHVDTFNRICEVSAVLRAVVEDFSRARGAWIAASNVEKFESDATWAAAMRVRLNCPHRTLDAAALKCPGCPEEPTADEFIPHVLGCTHIKDYNASSRHADLKLVLIEWAKQAGIGNAGGEPREFSSFVCPASKRTIFHDDFFVHCSSCEECDFKDLPRPSGPDIRFTFANFMSLVLDVTFISMANKSHREQSTTDAFDQRRAEKMAKYGAAVAKRCETLTVFGVTASGAMSTESTGFCRTAESVSKNRVCRHDMGRAVKHTSAMTGGMILANAEQKSGACIDSRYRGRKPLLDEPDRGAEYPMRVAEPADTTDSAETSVVVTTAPSSPDRPENDSPDRSPPLSAVRAEGPGRPAQGHREHPTPTTPISAAKNPVSDSPTGNQPDPTVQQLSFVEEEDEAPPATEEPSMDRPTTPTRGSHLNHRAEPFVPKPPPAAAPPATAAPPPPPPATSSLPPPPLAAVPVPPPPPPTWMAAQPAPPPPSYMRPAATAVAVAPSIAPKDRVLRGRSSRGEPHRLQCFQPELGALVPKPLQPAPQRGFAVPDLAAAGAALDAAATAYTVYTDTMEGARMVKRGAERVWSLLPADPRFKAAAREQPPTSEAQHVV